MRVAKEEESDGGRTVIVGVKMDLESKELLTWALVNVAKPQDRVIALHVIPEVSPPSGKCASLLSLVKNFDSVLAVYDGFCNLKQIDLKLKLCRGSSIRKVLVGEAKASAASKLILGVSQNPHGIRSSTTLVAQYCSKKLPKDCSVLAVNNGKIVFQRQSKEDKNSSKTHNGKSARRPSANCIPMRLSCGISMVRDESKDDSCSLYSRISSPPASPIAHGCGRDNSLALVAVKRSETLSKPGWPLLVLSGNKTNTFRENDKNSIVQWAKRLPSRYTVPTPIHPYRKYADRVGDKQAIVSVSRTALPRSIHNKAMELPEALRSLRVKYSSVCRLFRYKELKQATSNFSTENLIGKGGSSRVYKGRLSNGKELAVKVLKHSDDVVNEMEIVTLIRHKNIISLLGFCFEDGNLMLVYDLLSKGSLEETLHGDKERKHALGWVERYKIALGVAEALDYLHGDRNTEPVIHRDVKSSNILISDNFEPRLCDFGLAQWVSSSSSRMTCKDVAGTFGYVAPEYFMCGKVDVKIDVYAYGVVLLELISGRKPIDTSSHNGNESLVMWAEEILKGGKMKELVDPCLGDNYDNDQIERMILAASLCIRRVPRCRPHIASIMKLLQGDENMLRWARTQVKTSDAVSRKSSIQSYINLALLDVEDDARSMSSVRRSLGIVTANASLEDYLNGRRSSTPSFD